MVEQLGSGVPRILAHYPRTIYNFTPNFIRMVIPFSEGFEQDTGQDTGQVEKCLRFCETSRSTKEIMHHLGLKHRESFRNTILLPLIASGQLALTIPHKPLSLKQRYITVKHL